MGSTGVLQPMVEISELCKAHGAKFHTDAAQAIGKVPFSVEDSGADFVTIAAHKMGGPIGVGALYIRGGVELSRLLEGGSQEINRRPGTEAVALIVGFGEACRIANSVLSQEMTQIKKLRDRLEDTLFAELDNIRINSQSKPRLTNTCSLSIPEVSGEILVIRMDLEGYAISAGSACHSGKTTPSRTLQAMGLEDLATSTVRISLGPDTTEEELTGFAKTLIKVVKELKTKDSGFDE